MKKHALLLVALLALASAAQAQTTITALPAGSALTGTESIPMDQTGSCSATGGTCKTTPAAIDTYVLAQGVPLTALPSQATSTVLGNFTGSSGTPTALGALAIINMTNAVFAVDVVATANITLSGAQTIDGVAVTTGNFVLAAAQTTTTQNGVWLVQSGAWVRPANFPSGYIIPAFCDVAVIPLRGTANANLTFRLTVASAITIDTTAQNWARIGFGSGSGFASVNPTPTVGNCVSWSGTAQIANGVDASSQHGPCALTNSATGHLIINNGTFPPASSVGTLNTNSTDHWGQITGLTSASTIVLTFSAAWPNNVVACVASDSVGTAIGVTYTSSASTITAATFAPASALTGTLNYLCFGTN